MCFKRDSMANFWSLYGIPHKEWALVNVIDHREDGQRGLLLHQRVFAAK